MEIKNCKKCGKIFNYIRGPELCVTCKKEFDKKLSIVKDYIRKNPDKTIDDVSKETDTSKKQILEWIREEKICLKQNTEIKIFCRGCKKPILTGNFCQDCKKIFRYDNKDYNDIKDKPKMRFLNKK